jgi:hypothetical protein
MWVVVGSDRELSIRRFVAYTVDDLTPCSLLIQLSWKLVSDFPLRLDVLTPPRLCRTDPIGYRVHMEVAPLNQVQHTVKLLGQLTTSMLTLFHG